jgi:hypothetical protein
MLHAYIHIRKNKIRCYIPIFAYVKNKIGCYIPIFTYVKNKIRCYIPIFTYVKNKIRCYVPIFTYVKNKIRCYIPIFTYVKNKKKAHADGLSICFNELSPVYKLTVTQLVNKLRALYGIRSCIVITVMYQVRGLG